jgi:hypothetical protein
MRLRALGPSEERSVLATALAAMMFCFCASSPRTRAFWAPSCARMDSERTVKP